MNAFETAALINSYVSYVGTILSCPPPPDNKWWQKWWDARLALIELKLPQAIDAIGEFPVIPEHLEYPEADGANEVIASQREFHQDLARWLRPMMLEGIPIPEVAAEARSWEQTGVMPSPEVMRLLYRYSSAQLSVATYELAVATHPRSPSLSKLFPFPVSLWACVECSDNLWILRTSGVTGEPVIWGKTNSLENNVDALRKRQNLKVKAANQADLPEWRHQLHESETLFMRLDWEAHKIAKNDPDFDLNHYLPFLRTYQYVSNLKKRCESFQSISRLPDGTTFITGKYQKIPKQFMPKGFTPTRSRRKCLKKVNKNH